MRVFCYANNLGKLMSAAIHHRKRHVKYSVPEAMGT